MSDWLPQMITWEGLPQDVIVFAPRDPPPNWDRMSEADRRDWLGRHSCVIKNVGKP
jgi:hypothetical protein